MAEKRPKPKPPDALMFKTPPTGVHGAPVFITVDVEDIQWWRSLGWYLLADERSVRFADLEDVRRDDEARGRRTT